MMLRSLLGALGSVALSVFLGTACTGSEDASNARSPAAPTAIPTSTPSLATAAATLPPPTPRPQATPTITPAATATTTPLDNFPTGVASVDAAITAIELGDTEALAKQVSYTKHECVARADIQPLEGRPLCDPDEKTGDLVDGFTVAQCHGGTIRPNDFPLIREALDRYVSEPLRFYGAYHTSPSMWNGGIYFAVFYAPADRAGLAIAAVLDDVGLVGIGTGCGASPEELGAGLKPI